VVLAPGGESKAALVKKSVNASGDFALSRRVRSSRRNAGVTPLQSAAARGTTNSSCVESLAAKLLGGLDNLGWGKMTDEAREYYRLRELAERAAAKDAKTLAARRAHQELATMYWTRRRELGS
jgi:hypothetical protein